MVYGRNKIGGGAVAEGTVTNEFDFVVEALGHAVGDRKGGPGEDAIDMGFNQLREFLHRFQSAVRRLPKPVVEESFGMERAAVAPEELKAFLEQITAQQAAIGLHGGCQRQQASPLAGGQIPRILQQNEACSFDGLFARAREMADFLTADLIEGIQAVPNQVEAVEHQRGLRQVLPDGIGIWSPHITADRADRAATPRVEPLEEGIDGFALARLSDPDDAAAFQIVDQRQIRMALPAADFIHANHVQRLPSAALQSL